MRNYRIIGLTGPTGAGKSTVSSFFSQHGYVVIDADTIARQAFAKDSICLAQACGVFGSDILNSDGNLNRQALAEKAFSSKENTQKLNDIVHPWIFLRVMRLCRENIDKGKNKILFDAPVLFESNSDLMCDAVISVVAPEDVRMERLKKRDCLTEQQLKKRMSAQHNNDFYTSRSDYTIDGSLPLEQVRECAEKIISTISLEMNYG